MIGGLYRVGHFARWRLVLRRTKNIEAGSEEKPGRTGQAAGSIKQMARSINVNRTSQIRLIFALRGQHIGQVNNGLLILHCLGEVCWLPYVSLNQFDLANKASGGALMRFAPRHKAANLMALPQ